MPRGTKADEPTVGSVSLLLGEPDEAEQLWARWSVSNGAAKFAVMLQQVSRNHVDVLLETPKPFLVRRCKRAVEVFRLLCALGVIDPETCMLTSDSVDVEA